MASLSASPESHPKNKIHPKAKIHPKTKTHPETKIHPKSKIHPKTKTHTKNVDALAPAVLCRVVRSADERVGPAC